MSPLQTWVVYFSPPIEQLTTTYSICHRRKSSKNAMVGQKANLKEKMKQQDLRFCA